MNQNDQMLELCPSCRNSDIYACTCPFPSARNHAPDTSKMVRLTEIELWRNDELMALNAEFGLLFPDVKRFANAIMDAMIKKNGGAHATD